MKKEKCKSKIIKCKLYLRYIDNIFLIWTGPLEELNKFIVKMNQIHPSIEFDLNYSGSGVNLLDATVKKSSTGELSTMLYKKETDCQAYLHRKSKHAEP